MWPASNFLALEYREVNLVKCNLIRYAGSESRGGRTSVDVTDLAWIDRITC